MTIHYRKAEQHYHHLSLTNLDEPVDFEFLSNCVRLSDDLYVHLKDSFTWVQTTLENGTTYQGLDYSGVSHLDLENTKKFQEIISSWYQLFSLGNDPIVLTDLNHIDFEEEITIRVTFNQSDLLRNLKDIIDLCQEALDKNSGITVYGL